MEVIFEYEEKEYLAVNSIAIIGEFNDFDPNKGKMVKENNKWTFKCLLEPGEYKYKFLINGLLKLNDSTANIYLPDENEELWSVIMINKNNQRLYNHTQYTTHIDKYNITCAINEEQVALNKKSFNIMLDKKVVTRFEFTNVTGIHAVTTAWFTPKGELFQTTENNLFKLPEDDKPIVMWFWMDLENDIHKYPQGKWTMKLFIDGEYILEDQFNLMESSSYSAKGKMVY
ncbi:hypothetical protein C3495_01945 [Clostridiaceae bacterium 14S0207]|nr:hypothetical protein C3495_01945 [Clostridiaceae bacterium 14S0207]